MNARACALCFCLQSEDTAMRELAVRLVERVLARAIAEECMNLPGPSHHPAEMEAPAPDAELAAYHRGLEDSQSTVSSELREPSPHLPNLSLAEKGQQQQLHFSHVLQKDCFLVFRTLCKLSMKGVTDIHDPR